MIWTRGLACWILCVSGAPVERSVQFQESLRLSEFDHNQADDDSGGNVDPLVGKVLSGRFALEAMISRGGMGKVYRATQRPLDRVVALKVLDVSDQSGEFRRRFFKEASLCAKLSHPHTVRIYDYGATDDGIFYIAMEYLEGQTLYDMLHREAPVQPKRALRILRTVAGALAEAHDAGIVHRDLKPSNIFLVAHGDDREYPKVIDFGLVKEMGTESELSRTGNILGSPMYMAPEQVQGFDVDERTDVYALGLILYYALCGRTAVKRGNPMAVLMAQVQRTPASFHEVNPDLHIPPVIEWVVSTAIAKDPHKRFASMHEFIRALKVCELMLQGTISSPIELSLDRNGRVQLPSGVDVSEDRRAPAALRGTMPPPTPVPFTQGPDTTLLPNASGSLATDGIPAPMDTRSQVGPLLVAGGAFAGIGGAVVAAVVVVALGLVWWFSPSFTPSPETIPLPIEAPGAADVEVRLTSEPPDAEVERDGVFIGSTPLSVSVKEDEPWTVTVSHEGYASRTVRLAADQPELNVNLEALVAPSEAVEPAPQAGPAPAPEAAPAPAPAPRGDLIDPWANP